MLRLRHLQVGQEELKAARKNDVRKSLLAEMIQAQTSVRLDWINGQLGMGTRAGCCNLLKHRRKSQGVGRSSSPTTRSLFGRTQRPAGGILAKDHRPFCTRRRYRPRSRSRSSRKNTCWDVGGREIPAVGIRLSELRLLKPRQWGACWLGCQLWEQLVPCLLPAGHTQGPAQIPRQRPDTEGCIRKVRRRADARRSPPPVRRSETFGEEFREGRGI